MRQHDLRAPHRCSGVRRCSTMPLITVNHELYSVSRSPLTPYQLVVAGDSEFVGHLVELPFLCSIPEADLDLM